MMLYMLYMLGILASAHVVSTYAGLTTIIDDNDVKAPVGRDFAVQCQWRTVTNEEVKEASPLSGSKPLITLLPADYVVKGCTITTPWDLM